MKKKLEAELMSIAHRVLKLSGRNDLAKLHLEAQKLTEALSILRFYETNYAVASQEHSQAEFDEKLAAFLTAEKEVLEQETKTTTAIEAKEVGVEAKETTAIEEEIETQKEEISAPIVSENKEEEVAPKIVAETSPAVKNISKQISLEDFLTSDYKDPEFVKVEKIDISIKESTTVVFEKAIENEPVEETIEAHVEEEKEIEEEITSKEESSISAVEEISELEPIQEEEKVIADVAPVVETPKPSDPFAEASLGNVVLKSEYVQTIQKTETKTMSLNDRLTRGINIGLNDRIAFVKHLFNSNNEDYNRVISQLNTFNSHDEALSFIENMVKPDYQNWEGKEDYAERFLTIVEKKFM